MLVTEFRSWWQNLDLGDISFFLLLEQKVKKEYRLYCIVIEFKYNKVWNDTLFIVSWSLRIKVNKLSIMKRRFFYVYCNG